MKHIKVFENFEGDENSTNDQQSNVDNYMFFSNLENIVKMAQNILSMDKDRIDEMLTKQHDWANDHVSVSKENLEHVNDWLNSQFK
jgi:hypothetical protein